MTNLFSKAIFSALLVGLSYVAPTFAEEPKQTRPLAEWQIIEQRNGARSDRIEETVQSMHDSVMHLHEILLCSDNEIEVRDAFLKVKRLVDDTLEPSDEFKEKYNIKTYAEMRPQIAYDINTNFAIENYEDRQELKVFVDLGDNESMMVTSTNPRNKERRYVTVDFFCDKEGEDYRVGFYDGYQEQEHSWLRYNMGKLGPDTVIAKGTKGREKLQQIIGQTELTAEMTTAQMHAAIMEDRNKLYEESVDKAYDALVQNCTDRKAVLVELISDLDKEFVYHKNMVSKTQ